MVAPGDSASAERENVGCETFTHINTNTERETGKEERRKRERERGREGERKETGRGGERDKDRAQSKLRADILELTNASQRNISGQPLLQQGWWWGRGRRGGKIKGKQQGQERRKRTECFSRNCVSSSDRRSSGRSQGMVEDCKAGG